MPRRTSDLTRDVAEVARPLNAPADLDLLLDRVGDARFVLLGEASHGTHEYYEWRAAITQRLVEEKDFSLVAVEGDWPDCYEVNRYVKEYDGAAASARDALSSFERWPTWMWGNHEVEALAEWLRGVNDGKDSEEKVGFYGFDVYSLWESLDAIIEYLEDASPESVDAARRAYACFEPYAEDAQEYARATALVPEGCEDEVVRLLGELRTRRDELPQDHESRFNAEQNAFVARNAERYYRAMIRGGPESWNVRDTHMADTLDALMDRHGDDAKCIVWAHNTHVGDAKFTDMHRAGMTNVGRLVRERHGEDDTVLVGFGSHRGSVIAGAFWGAPMRRMTVPPAQEGSWEDLLHQATGGGNVLIGSDELDVVEGADDRRDHRAIGVVYHPASERFGNYVPTVLPRRYDAFLFIDETKALSPIGLAAKLDEEPETYPFGV